MRVLALTNLYPTPFQPHRAAFNRQQFRALAEEHEVRVIAPIAWTGEWTARRRTNATALMPANRQRIVDGMLVHHPRYRFTPKILRGWYGQFMVQSVRSCFHDVVQRYHPDVVLGCWAYPDGWAAVRLAREAGLPVAIKVHGSDLLTIDDQPTRRRRTIEALTAADAIIAVSRHLGEHAIAMGAEYSRVHTVYNGIDADVFSPGPRDAARMHLGISSSDPLIVFIGNLVPVKAIDVLIDALASLARGGCRFQCALVGEGPLKDQLQAQVNSLGLGANVRLVGSQPQRELPFWYRSADLFVLPSLSEGIPNVLLEAAACGTPFVASAVGGIPEISHAEALVPPGNSAALAERIRVYLNPNTRPTASLKFKPGSWSDSARTLAAALQTIVADTPLALSRAG